MLLFVCTYSIPSIVSIFIHLIICLIRPTRRYLSLLNLSEFHTQQQRLATLAITCTLDRPCGLNVGAKWQEKEHYREPSNTFQQVSVSSILTAHIIEIDVTCTCTCLETAVVHDHVLLIFLKFCRCCQYMYNIGNIIVQYILSEVASSLDTIEKQILSCFY